MRHVADGLPPVMVRPDGWHGQAGHADKVTSPSQGPAPRDAHERNSPIGAAPQLPCGRLQYTVCHHAPATPRRLPAVLRVYFAIQPLRLLRSCSSPVLHPRASHGAGWSHLLCARGDARVRAPIATQMVQDIETTGFNSVQGRQRSAQQITLRTSASTASRTTTAGGLVFLAYTRASFPTPFSMPPSSSMGDALVPHRPASVHHGAPSHLQHLLAHQPEHTTPWTAQMDVLSNQPSTIPPASSSDSAASGSESVSAEPSGALALPTM